MKPLLVPGGAYSEDREFRIRTRFAVVSGLAASGYAPQSAEHMGLAEVDWLTERGLQSWVTAMGVQPPGSNDIHPLTSHCGCSCNSNGETITEIGGCSDENCPYKLERQFLSFEWYRQRTFFPATTNQERAQRVLVLWISEGICEDSPMLRLAILAKKLGLLEERTLDVLGPRRSSTLRVMIPKLGTLNTKNDTNDLEVLGKLIPPARKVLLNNSDSGRPPLAFHSPTASAMDEVLIDLQKFEDKTTPRAQVIQVLQQTKLASFSNYTATDDAYAAALYDELKLRGVDVGGKKQDDLVMISEIDTFYGRVLSLTYQAEAAIRQSGSDGPTTRKAFIQAYIKHGQCPENIHFVNYLRGLDGQTTEGNTANSSAKSTLQRSYTSLQSLLEEQTNINRAEGQNQFDYLLRLKNQLNELDRELRAKKGKGIRAICIVGSDTHDTIQILKAVRPEFPNTLFMTTDLDARFCDPNEWNHTRNLIVASSYGLSIPLQNNVGTMPFRDSHQMAYFVASTNILSSATNDRSIKPQLFEIGRREPVLLLTNAANSQRKPFPLVKALSVFFGCIILIALANYIAPNTWASISGSPKFLKSKLWFKEADVHDPDSVVQHVSTMLSTDQKTDATNSPETDIKYHLAKSLSAFLFKYSKDSTNISYNTFPELKLARSDRDFLESLIKIFADSKRDKFNAAEGKSSGTDTDREAEVPNPYALKLATRRLENFISQAVSAWMNEWIDPDKDDKLDIDLLKKDSEFFSSEATEDFKRSLETNFGEKPDWEARLLARKKLMDEFFYYLMQPASTSSNEALNKDSSEQERKKSQCFINARRLSYKHAKKNFRAWRWTIGIGFLLILILACFAFLNANWMLDGEPLTLVQGVSIWPTEFLRLGALILGLCLIFQSRCILKQATCEIALKYKLPLRWNHRKTQVHLPVGLTDDLAKMKVDDLWSALLTLGNNPSRRLRVTRNCLFYLAFGMMLGFAEGFPLIPFRGELSRVLDIGLLATSVAVYLYLTFLTIDAAAVGCVFINHLAYKSSEYSTQTIEHFRRHLGGISKNYINECIDINLIADVTERLSRLLYFPFIIFLVFLVSRSSIWDKWPWPYFLVTIFVLNLVFSLLGFLILYRSANNARAQALENLEAKVKQASAFASPEPSENDAKQAHALLEELRGIRKGAFAGFWESPILGALLIPAGGSVIFELIAYLL